MRSWPWPVSVTCCKGQRSKRSLWRLGDIMAGNWGKAGDTYCVLRINLVLKVLKTPMTRRNASCQLDEADDNFKRQFLHWVLECFGTCIYLKHHQHYFGVLFHERALSLLTYFVFLMFYKLWVISLKWNSAVVLGSCTVSDSLRQKLKRCCESKQTWHSMEKGGKIECSRQTLFIWKLFLKRFKKTGWKNT